VASLRLAAEAAQVSGETPDHVLLCGRPGLGKTTLARAFATEIGGRLIAVNSATVDGPFTLIGHLMHARDGDVIFLDEIHALPPKIAESLYGAFEDGVLDLQFTDGLTTKAVQFELPRITFIGATTNPELLPEPFLARFPMQVELDPYTPDELCEIVQCAARSKRLDVAPEAAAILARASSGCARMAVTLFRGLRRVVVKRRRPSAAEEDARAALADARIDADGLGRVHRRVLEVLARHRRPMAYRRLARAAGVSVKAFRDLYEPALFELGAIVPTARGMVIAAGWEGLG
jgi:Holliday junction DNA helicase RuvB